jgi:hypothetical protein
MDEMKGAKLVKIFLVVTALFWREGKIRPEPMGDLVAQV